MHSLPQEFLALCRQLGDAQQRCSAAMQAQAQQIEALTAEVVRLRGAVIVRDTRLALAQDALEQLRAASPSLPRRQAMVRHMGLLAERITALSRECRRWRQAAAEGGASAIGSPMAVPPGIRESAERAQRCGEAVNLALDANLAAADLVICQTGCISHDEYWRVQDHCRRTGKPCILVDQPLAVREAQALATMQPMVVLRMAAVPQPPATGAAGVKEAPVPAAEVVNENRQ